MTHIDEHTLELYLLGAPEVLARANEIRKHLLQCESCRQVFEEFASQYDGVSANLSEFKLRPVSETTAIEPVHGRLVPFEDMYETVRKDRSGVLAQFVGSVRRHPVASVGAIGLVAACVFGLATYMNRFDPAKNPQFGLMNHATKRIEVFNGQSNLLWDMPCREFMWGLGDSGRVSSPDIAIADLDGDERNEVIASARFIGGDGSLPFTLRVFEFDKTQRFERTFPVRLQYAANVYAETMPTAYVLIPDQKPRKAKDIVVSLQGRRSPFGLVRVNNQGAIIGQYWHYGQLYYGYLTNIAGLFERAMLCTGSNDVEDTLGIDHAHFPVIAVLDARKITDMRESSATRGFGFQSSTAEVFYIKLPTDDLASARDLQVGIHLQYQTDSSLVFTCETILAGRIEMNSGFDYAFNRSMEILWVKPVDGDKELHEELRKKGIIKSVWNQQYLDNLKSQVQYWDGTQWRNEWCKVKNPQ